MPGYIARFEIAKVQAQQQINNTMAQIQSELSNSVNTLKASGQTVSFNLEEVVTLLEQARDRWLTDMKAVFDSAILNLKGNLHNLR